MEMACALYSTHTVAYYRSYVYTMTTDTTFPFHYPPGFGFGTFAFLIFINDLPKFVNDKSVPILFANDTSIFLCVPFKSY